MSTLSNYSFISVVAMGCYLILFLAFMAAKKNKIINAFLYLMVIFLLWTGGSFFMRSGLFPGVSFWYDVSIIGLIMLPFAFFNFIHAFVNSEKKFFWKLWLTLCIVNCFLNTFWDVYIPFPEVHHLADGTLGFTYHLTWTVGLILLFAAIIVVHMFIIMISYGKKDAVARSQFAPIFWGIAILFLGHFGTMIPFFNGFPTDILSGIVNAVFLFYALYRRHLFKLTLLVSRGVIYTVSLLLTVLLFVNQLRPVERFIAVKISSFATYDVVIVAVLFTVVTILLSAVLRKFIDILFTKDEAQQAENLKDFSFAVSRSLEMNEILDELIEVIQKTIGVKKIYICTPEANSDNFSILRSTSPLDGKSLVLGINNPAIQWLVKNKKCVLMRDFCRSMYYKSMWEQEKRQLHDLKIECIAPLMDNENLVGIILLSIKNHNKGYTYDDLNLLDSVNSIGSIALNNSRLYRKAYLEARTDELTGLLNRKYFYEVLQEEAAACKDSSLALIIINIDDFKLYNQLYGMKEGDNALKEIAKLIRNAVGNNGHTARYSGKEFAIILPKADVFAARQLAERIRKQICSMHYKESDYAMKMLTISGGICAIPYSAGSTKELVENADMAVFSVKRRGKNSILIYEAGFVGEEIKEENINKEEVYSEYASTIYALTATIDTKDHYTFSHSKNVAYYAVELAIAMGMNKDFVEIVREAGLLHDIGKIGIPEHILNKPGRLTRDEYEIMKTHVEHSIGIIRNLPSLDYVIPAVLGHHERFDGNGYPRGLKGKEIPLSARMLCVADSFDAMISKRSYKESYEIDYALTEVERQGGKQFDPVLAETFVRLVKSGKVKVETKGESPEISDTPEKGDDEIVS